MKSRFIFDPEYWKGKFLSFTQDSTLRIPFFIGRRKNLILPDNMTVVSGRRLYILEFWPMRWKVKRYYRILKLACYVRQIVKYEDYRDGLSNFCFVERI